MPLAEPEMMSDESLGSRHRAAIGLSAECDAIVVIVSEESGIISIAERGQLTRDLTPDDLAISLTRRLERSNPERVSRLRKLLRARRAEDRVALASNLKKYVTAYAKGLHGSAAFRERVLHAGDADAMVELAREFFAGRQEAA